MGCCVIITGKTHTIIVGFEEKKQMWEPETESASEREP